MDANCISAWANAIMALVAILSFGLVIYGYNQWKRQYVSQKDYELSIDIIKKMRRVRRILEFINVAGIDATFDKELSTASTDLTDSLTDAQIILAKDFSAAIASLNRFMRDYYIFIGAEVDKTGLSIDLDNLPRIELDRETNAQYLSRLDGILDEMKKPLREKINYLRESLSARI